MTMLSSTVSRNIISITPIIPTTTRIKFKSAKSNPLKFQFRVRATRSSNSRPSTLQQTHNREKQKEKEDKLPRVLLNTLRVLEWASLCDVVSSFAGTSLGRDSLQEQLWKLDQTYDESLRLLRETNAAVELHKYNDGIMDFTAIDVLLVESAINHARRDKPVNGREAVAVAVLLQFAESLQLNIKTAIKESANMNERFMPLSEWILGWVTNNSLVRSILRVVNEDGSVKDSASPKLKQARWRVSHLESKLSQLMNTLIANEVAPSLEARSINGRWCIKSGTGQLTTFQGLLLSSGSGMGNIIEPVSAVPLNDELIEAKASVADAEAEVLLDITGKIKMDLDAIDMLLRSIVELDVVNARASYGLSMKGTCPELLLLDDNDAPLSSEGFSDKGNAFQRAYSKKELILHLPKAYHPLLLHQHKRRLLEAKKDVANTTAEFRRRRMYGQIISQQEATPVDIQVLQEKVAQLEKAHPVPVDFLIDKNTRVLLITGPNTGGKTICLKSVGLAAIMAKAGLYVFCSEPARIPWFDNVFADIGDEQSLSQSLSTFSGHLRQISGIQAKSTNQSLVLLDEIGAGTNPLEGAALGISVLESFAEAGALLTIATTHHGELKTLKYSNAAFENACMEFDEVNLRPTYRILWGVPGRSNAINIAERLGLPAVILHNAREQYGAASAEIDEVIFDLEKFKQDVEENTHEAEHYLMRSKDLHEKLLDVQRKLTEHGFDLRQRKIQQISELASRARSMLHRKMQEYRASARQVQSTRTEMSLPKNLPSLRSIYASPVKQVKQSSPVTSQSSTERASVPSLESKGASSVDQVKQSSTGAKRKKVIPKVGDVIQVSSRGLNGKVLKVEPSKGEIVVQAGILKLKLKISDINI